MATLLSSSGLWTSYYCPCPIHIFPIFCFAKPQWITEHTYFIRVICWRRKPSALHHEELHNFVWSSPIVFCGQPFWPNLGFFLVSAPTLERSNPLLVVSALPSTRFGLFLRFTPSWCCPTSLPGACRLAFFCPKLLPWLLPTISGWVRRPYPVFFHLFQAFFLYNRCCFFARSKSLMLHLHVVPSACLTPFSLDLIIPNSSPCANQDLPKSI